MNTLGSDIERVRLLVTTLLAKKKKCVWIQLADTGSLRPLVAGGVYAYADFAEAVSAGIGDICLIQSGPVLGNLLIVHRIVDRRTSNGVEEFMHSPESPTSIVTIQWVPRSSILAKITALQLDIPRGETLVLRGRLNRWHSLMAAYSTRMIIKYLFYRLGTQTRRRNPIKLTAYWILIVILRAELRTFAALFKAVSLIAVSKQVSFRTRS